MVLNEPSPSLDYLAAVGALTLNWATLETTLDFIVAMLFHEHGGRIIEAGIPRALDKKLRFAKKAISRAPALTSVRERATKVLNLAIEQKDDRHRIVHSGLVDDGATPDAIAILRVRYQPTMHVTQMEVVTREEVVKAANAASLLSDEIVAVAVAIYNLTRPEDPIDHPLGEVV